MVNTIAIILASILLGGYLCFLLRWIYRLPHSLKPDYFKQGTRKFYRGKYAAAATKYSRAIEKNPENVDAYLCRAYAYLCMDELDKALEDCDTVTELNPANHTAFFYRGSIYARKEDYHRSITETTHCLELQPDFHDAFLNRGYSLIYLEKFEEAIADYSKAIELSPSHIDAIVDRGNLYLNMNLFKAAIEDFTHALKLGEQSAELLPSRGLAYMEIGEYEKAKQDFEEALQKHPDSPYAFVGLAWILATCPVSQYRNGNRALELALRNLELVTTPEWSDFGTLAAAYAEIGHFEDANKWAQKSMSIVPEHEKSKVEAQLKCYENNQAYIDLKH